MTLYDLVSQDVSLTLRNNEGWGLCPFHQEKTPSFSVNIDRQVFYCFGCGAKGNAYTYLVSKRGLSPREALRILGNNDLHRPRHDPQIHVVRNAFLEWQQHALADIMAMYHDVMYQVFQLQEMIRHTVHDADFADFATTQEWHQAHDRYHLIAHELLEQMEWWSGHATQADCIALWDTEQQGGQCAQ